MGCNQVRVIYTDPDKGEWALLKDLECFLQNKVDNGEPAPGGADIEQLIESAKTIADSSVFAQGSQKARETQGSFEMTFTGDAREMSRDEAKEEVKRLREERVVEVEPARKQ